MKKLFLFLTTIACFMSCSKEENPNNTAPSDKCGLIGEYYSPGLPDYIVFELRDDETLWQLGVNTGTWATSNQCKKLLLKEYAPSKVVVEATITSFDGKRLVLGGGGLLSGEYYRK